MNVGIYNNLSNEEYHASEGVSRSTLWDIYNRTPAHAMFSVRKESKTFDAGTAFHCAILEPHRFGSVYGRLPDGHNGTTKAGKEATASLEAMGLTPVKADLYDAIIATQRKVYQEPLIVKALAGAQIEHSAYATDPMNGMLVKCRPDSYSPDLKIMLDVKTTVDASSAEFAKSIANYGYHVQQAFYRDVWQNAGGGDVEAFIFLAVEKEAPYAYSIFELDAEDEEIGRAIYKNALLKYAECKALNTWPAYPSGVQPISLPAWARSRMSEALV